jgi:hypothetical protein
LENLCDGIRPRSRMHRIQKASVMAPLDR